MAFVAVATNDAGVLETLGVVRAIADPENTSAEFAILVRSDLEGRGLGHALLGKIVCYCRDRGTRELTGEVCSPATLTCSPSPPRGDSKRTAPPRIPA